jgi:TonB family protein
MARKKAKSQTIRIEVENLGNVQVFHLGTREAFTIGYRTTNTFPLFGKEVPASFDLVRGKGDRIVLKVRDSMVGEVIRGDSRLPIPDLIRHRLLRRHKDGYVLELGPDQRAWVRLKDTVFRIGFDGAAAIKEEVPYWKLSRRIYRQLTTDPLFKIILIIFLALGAHFSYRIHGTPLPKREKIDLKKYTRHVARIIIRPTSRDIAARTGRGTVTEAPKKTDTEPSSGKSSKKESESASARREAARKAIMKKGLVGLIAGKGTPGKTSTVIEALVDRGLVREIDEVLKSGQNLEIELPSLDDIGTGFEGLLDSASTGVDELISGMQVEDRVELSDKGDVQLEEFGQISGSDAALGWRSEQSIRDVILSYMGRVTYTYNKYLKQNPDLKGKVVVEMTIAPSGEVVDCRIVSSTMNHPDFEKDLLKVVRSFRFKPIPEGTVTVQNPFVFYRRDAS